MDQGSPVDKIAHAYYRREWLRRPSNGSRAGLVEYDDRLEVPTADLIADEIADLSATRQELDNLSEPASDTTLWLDRQAFAAHLELEHLGLVDIQHWRTNPVEPLETALGAIFGLLMRRDVSKPETAEAIRRRLLAMPAFLDATRHRIEQPVQIWVVAARSTGHGAVDFLREAIPELARSHPKLQTGLGQAADAAIHSLAAYNQWLDSLDGRPLSDDPAVGEQVLGQIVRTSHGLPYTLEEIDEIAGREIERITREMAELARTVDSDRPWMQILEDHRQQFAARPHDLINEYRASTFGLRDRLVADGVLDLPPGETLEVISTPNFLRPLIPSAAYSSPGPLDAIQRGIYYVSDPPPSLPPDEFRANLGQHFGFESTCAHEAYPGHHVQLCWANQATSLARQMAHHIIFMEGWTVYCEQLMVELGYLATPLWELDCLHSQLWRAHRIRIDVRLHTRRVSIREAIDTLIREVGFTERRAQAELNWYTQQPGTPMSYLLGRHETLGLRELYRSRHPGCTLREFHNWLLSFRGPRRVGRFALREEFQQILARAGGLAGLGGPA
ncbi:MAG: DUF885 domain-containing protein [Planctomycetes bacterium]|nr:DUF885 domain-containing protein [Planctomycetota bacterium]